MSSKFHFDHHRREAVINRKRFSLTSALLLMVVLAGVGTIIKQSSFASSWVVSGAVKLNGAAYPGISITSCHTNPTVKTSSTGAYSIVLTGRAYCARSAGAKSYYHLTPMNVTADIKGVTTYEEQIASYNCYHILTTPCPNTKVTGSPYHWDRSVDSATNFNYTYVFATAPKLSGATSTSQVNLSWTGAKTDSGVKAYLVYSGNTLAKTVAGTVTSTTMPITCGTTYSFKVQTQDKNNLNSASSNIYTGSVACPPPPPTPTTTVKPTPPAPSATPVPTASATPKPTPKPTVKPIAPKPGVVNPTQTGTPAAPTDTAPPSVPEGFSAAVSQGGGDVVLGWSASKDSSGIKSYNIERSVDKTTWDSLDTTGETKYDDKTVTFDTHYYYRLTATDNAANTSDYAFADVTTSAYQANTGSENTQLASDDSIASVSIPPDAIPSGADCSVIKGDAQVGLSKGQSIIAGPYQLLCKDADGNQVASFTKEVTWNYQFKNQLKGFGAPIAVTFDDSSKAAKSKSTYDKKTKTISFTQAAGTQTLVLASKTKGVPVNLIIGILFVLGIIAAIFFFLLRRGQKQNYSEYIRSKYYDI